MPRTHVVALLFPQVTQLDLTGPAQIFARLPDTTVHLAWRDTQPVATDAGFSIVPTVDLVDAPQADVLMVPGGAGVFDLLADDEVLEFVRRQAVGARFVTSVCTGAFLLGAAGLLSGRRATTHWASHPLLELLGAVPVPERVVVDGDLVTGGGVTSGIDFALTVAEALHGPDVARAAQLTVEYDPRPPFDAGHPARPEADARLVAASLASVAERRGPVVRRAAERLAGQPH